MKRRWPRRTAPASRRAAATAATSGVRRSGSAGGGSAPDPRTGRRRRRRNEHAGGSNEIARGSGAAGGDGSRAAGRRLVVGEPAAPGSACLNAACTVRREVELGPVRVRDLERGRRRRARHQRPCAGCVRSMTPRNSSAQAIFAASNSSSRVRAAASLSVRRAVDAARAGRPASGSHLGELAVRRRATGASTTSSRSEVAQHEGAVADAPHGGEQQLLGRELEVDGALGQHAVLELEGARGRRRARRRGCARPSRAPLRASSRWFTKPLSASTFASGLPGPTLALTSSSCSGVMRPLSMRIAPSWSRGSLDEPKRTRPPRK